MKKVLALIFFFLTIPSVSFAEKFVCSYLFKGEPKSIVFERVGRFFEKSNGAKNKIIFEDEEAIVLSNTFTGVKKTKPMTFSTIIDKIELTFVFVGLEYQNNTAIVEGKCKLF